MNLCINIILLIFGAQLFFFSTPSSADLIEDASEEQPQTAAPANSSKGSGGNGGQSNLLQDDSAPRTKIPVQKAKSPEPSQVSSPQYQDVKNPPPKKPSDKADKTGRNRNPDAPIHFTSIGLDGNRNDGVIILEKNVVVTQDDMKITADKATITADKITEEVTEIFAQGNVHFYRKDPETGQPVTSDSKEALFNNKTRTVILKGDPKLVRGTDVVRGKQIIYDLTTGWVKATRVEGVVQPKKAAEPLKKPGTEKSPSDKPSTLKNSDQEGEEM